MLKITTYVDVISVLLDQLTISFLKSNKNIYFLFVYVINTNNELNNVTIFSLRKFSQRNLKITNYDKYNFLV